MKISTSKKWLVALAAPLLLNTFLVQSALAQTRNYTYPAIYPFKAEYTFKIYNDVRTVTEDVDFIHNFNEIISQNLSKAKTKDKPWTASYWPLSKGTIADPYEDSAIPYYVDWSWVNWKSNYKNFQKRLNRELRNVDRMSDEELAKLAPSEKYDLLLGDRSFDLTRRLWDYMNKWGSKKEHAFITDLLLVGDNSLDLAHNYIDQNFYSSVDEAFANSWNLKETLSAQRALELVASGRYSNAETAFSEALQMAKREAGNYVLEKKNSRIAGWEGICNGWATAAGLVPRPRRAVSIRLPNGQNLKFYPSDIKGLVSLYYVNSLIQDPAQIGNDGMPVTQGTVSAGLRCNIKNAKRDIWGRLYDDQDDPFNDPLYGARDSRCSGVHPATWHMGLVNLIGKQGRSFVVERKVGAAVDNHPMYSYEMKYFNPNSGWHEKNLMDNIAPADEDDQFKQFRNERTKYIVGVETTITYLNYKKPGRQETTSEKDDSEVDKTMLYDLELDENFNIIGGQWRALKVGYAPDPMGPDKEFLNHNQPDFFWTITKDYKKTGWFSNNTNIEPWTDKTEAPPANWINTALGYHAFEYKMNVEIGNVGTCRMKNRKTGKMVKVFCEQSYNRPQPLINVINGLVEMSK